MTSIHFDGTGRICQSTTRSAEPGTTLRKACLLQRPLVDAVDLVDLTPEGLQVRQHQLGGLRDLYRVHVEEAPVAGGDLLQHGVQERVSAQPLVPGKDAGAVDDEPAGAAVFQQEVDDAPRGDPSVGALQRRRKVGKAEEETRDLSLAEQELDQDGSATVTRSEVIWRISLSLSG